MKGVIHRRPFLSYYLLALLFATLVWGYVVAAEIRYGILHPGESLISHFYLTRQAIIDASPILHHHADSVILFIATYVQVPVASVAFFFPFAPTMAAVIVVSVGWGWSGLQALLGAFKPTRGRISRRTALRIYGFLAVGIVVHVGITLWLVLTVDSQARFEVMLRHLGFIDWRYAVATWFVAAVFTQGALLEELGWRGYAWPVLMRSAAAPLLMAMLLGLAWALWHLPREIVTVLSGQWSTMRFLIEQGWFILACMSASVVMVYFVNATGGSVLPAIIIHGMFNFVTPMLWLDATTGQRAPAAMFDGWAALLWVSAAVLTVLMGGKDLAWKKRLALFGGDGRNDPANVFSGFAVGTHEQKRIAE